MTRRSTWTTAAGFLLLASCTTTRHLYSGEERPQEEIALVSTSLKQSSGKNKIHVELETVDGMRVDAEHHGLVAVLPGRHAFEFSFSKKTESGGFPISLGLNLFGSKSSVYEPPADRVISSTRNKIVYLSVEAGKSYRITSRDTLSIGKTRAPKDVPSELAAAFERDVVRGTWTPGLSAGD